MICTQDIEDIFYKEWKRKTGKLEDIHIIEVAVEREGNKTIGNVIYYDGLMADGDYPLGSRKCRIDIVDGKIKIKF